MSKSALLAAPTDTGRKATTVAVAFVGLLTLWRVLWLLTDATTLSTDEAQYWLWGQEMAFGAYSKPPLIGWMIRAATEIAGSDVFGVRVAAPLMHGATALIILALAQRLTTPFIAAFAAVSYLTMPAIALGSALITTDTPLLFFAAAALYFQHKLAEVRRGGLILALGMAIGLGFLSKYAMIYVLLGMIAAAIASADWRIPGRAVLPVALIAGAVLLPNLMWIASHRFVTIQHVASDAEWQGLRLYPMQALRYLAEQLAVMGPILFLAWIAGLVRLRRMPRAHIGLYAASAMPLLIVTLQALTSRALANWGVTFAVAGVIVATVVLSKSRVLMALSLAAGLTISLALPVVMALGTGWRMPDGRLYLRRYLGQPDIIEWAVAEAKAGGAASIIAEDRDLLSGLSYAARSAGVAVMAPPGDGAPRHHWDLLYRYQDAPSSGTVFILTEAGTSLAALCADARTEARTAGPGYLEGRNFILRLITDTDCLEAAAHD